MEQHRRYVLIFANGMIEELEWVRPLTTRAEATIAADGGIRHLLALGQTPGVLIGDLDSLPAGVADVMDQWPTKIMRHPASKDETDLELALLFAKARFPDVELIVLGGFGGRLDHTLANLMLLAHPELISYPVRFITNHESAWLVNDRTTIVGHIGDTVSLIPLGGAARVLETTGLRWALSEETLEFGPARGMSNELTAERATIRLESGLLLCIHHSPNGENL